MRRFRSYAAIILALLLPGCASMGYAMHHYSGVPVEQHQYGRDTWRIFDKPEEGRMMVTASIGGAVATGAVQGATLGLSGPLTGPMGAYRAAAQDYLASQGRDCTITTGGLIIEPQYEFFYECRPAAA